MLISIPSHIQLSTGEQFIVLTLCLVAVFCIYGLLEGDK